MFHRTVIIMMKPGFLNIVSLLLVGAGMAIVIPVGSRGYSQPLVDDGEVVTTSVSSRSIEIRDEKTEVVSGVPIHISIPDLAISTDVKNGFYDATTHNWTIDEYSAFFATITHPANNVEGNTFIYAHNSDILFGRLPNISGGSKAIVTTDNGYRFTYRLTDSETLRPTDTQTLDYQGKPRLSLQTCTGLWNQYRHMFYFELVDYKKI